MASIREKYTKSGVLFYEIGVSRGRGKSKVYKRWYPADGWSKRTIERELNKAARDFERQVQAGAALGREDKKELERERLREAAKVQTFKEYGENVFMPSKAVSISENTRTVWQQCLNNRIYPAIGDLKMPDITPANISALLLSMQMEGLAHATVIKHYSLLSTFFKMAYLNDAIPRNPMDKVERPKPRKGEKTGGEVDAFTADELSYILQCLEGEPLQWRLYVSLLLETGIRRGECCALRWEDINMESRSITIKGNLCYTPERGVYLDTPKNGRERTVYFSAALLPLLRQHRQQQSESAVSVYVFTKQGSYEPMHPQSPTRYFSKFGERYGVQGMHPHKLRHSFASVAITNGADIASVSEALGHSDKAVTLRMYTHADQESIKRAGEVFREALKEKQA